MSLLRCKKSAKQFASFLHTLIPPFIRYYELPYSDDDCHYDLYHMMASCCPAWLFHVPPCPFPMGYLGLVLTVDGVKNQVTGGWQG